MIISAHQPYFSPFPGFFAKALRSDVLVLMDRVQFPRGSTWLTRNRFKNDQGVFRLTVPVWKKGLGLQKISEVRICHERKWGRKCLEGLKSAYANAPFFEEHLAFLEQVFIKPYERLIDLNMEIIQYLLKFMKIPVTVRLLSDLGIEEKEPQLSVAVCKALGAGRFLAENSGAKYLDPGIFQAAGCELIFFRYRAPVYPQLWGDFAPNLSVFDLLFNCGPYAKKILMGH